MRARLEVRRKALDLLARREHSRAELRRKLEGRGYAAAPIAEVLDALEAQRLVSDERFAQALVRSRIARGCGPLRIRAELREKGVADEVAALHLEPADEVWIERLREVRRRRFGEAPPVDARDEARQARFLSARGFTRAQIGAVMRSERAGGAG